MAQPLGLGVGDVIQLLLFKPHKGSLDITNPSFVHLPGVAAQRFTLFPPVPSSDHALDLSTVTYPKHPGIRASLFAM